MFSNQPKSWFASLVATTLLVIMFTSPSNASDRIRVAFFPGGPEKGSFASVVHNGAKTAGEDLGVEIYYYWIQDVTPFSPSKWHPRGWSGCLATI